MSQLSPLKIAEVYAIRTSLSFRTQKMSQLFPLKMAAVYAIRTSVSFWTQKISQLFPLKIAEVYAIRTSVSFWTQKISQLFLLKIAEVYAIRTGPSFCLKKKKVCRQEDRKAVSPDCELTTAQCRMKIQRRVRNQRPLSGGAIVLRPVKKIIDHRSHNWSDDPMDFGCRTN